MKELTIEEKAKRYDEAYKVAKNIHIFSSDLAGIKRMEEIFPELKEESDDERIRKALINGFNKLDKSAVWYNGITNGQILAWHEKQNEQKHTDNVEPKFKVGDWVVYTGYLLKDSGKEIYVMQVASVEDDRYNFTDTSTLCFDSEKDMRSWTIQDAKAGDVLVASDKSLFIYDGSINENGSVGFHIAFAKDTDIILNSDDGCGWEEKDSCHPATKEQRDQLEKAMADAGYTFDFEKKELKKIEQKPAWGEEDETKIKSIIALLKSPALCTMDGNKGIIDESIKYLKSLKYRVQPQQEWSKEDEEIIEALISLCDEAKDNIPQLSALKNWLKSLRPQNTWKPSDEQLYWLKWTVNRMPDTEKANEAEAVLEDLLEQLKKLK